MLALLLKRMSVSLFPLKTRIDGPLFVVGTPRRMYRIRALLALVPLPILLGILVGLIYVYVVDVKQTVAPGPEVDQGFTFSALSLAGTSLLWGLGLLLFAGSLAKRSEVVFDRARRIVRRERDGLTVPWDAIARVSVRRRETSWKALQFYVLELVGKNGESLLPIHTRLSEQHGTAIEAIARELTECLADPGYRSASAVVADVPTIVPREVKLVVPPNTAAMLCYLPIYGIGLFASIYYAFAARDRPFVRFAALQSLVQMVFSFVSLVLFVALAVPIEALDRGEASMAVQTLFFALFAVLGLWAFGAHVYAAVQANRGKLWVMPWLRPLLRRFIPKDG